MNFQRLLYKYIQKNAIEHNLYVTVENTTPTITQTLVHTMFHPYKSKKKETVGERRDDR